MPGTVRSSQAESLSRWVTMLDAKLPSKLDVRHQMVMDGIYTSHASEEYEAYHVGAVAGFMCLRKTKTRPKLSWAG
jgi:hypothetical protein